MVLAYAIRKCSMKLRNVHLDDSALDVVGPGPPDEWPEAVRTERGLRGCARASGATAIPVEAWAARKGAGSRGPPPCRPGA